MTELHLKSLSRLTAHVRLAYDGDAAGVKATERAIMMAGDLGVNLSVISDYHGAKDPDELIQKDPKLWQEAVQNYRPAVDWLLDKYEENLDLSSARGKKEYSDVAMKLLKYVQDAVERKHYEQLVARRLDCSVEDLRAKKVGNETPKRLKKVTGKAEKDAVGGLRDNLQALLIFGGVTGVKGVDLPEDETRLAELELVFEARYKDWKGPALEKEAKELLGRLKIEETKQEIEALSEELGKVEAESDRKRAEGASEEELEQLEAKYNEILRKIMALKR